MNSYADYYRWIRIEISATALPSKAITNRLSNRTDLNFDEFLAMTGATFAVLPAAEFLNRQFFAFGLSNHFCRNNSSSDVWFAQLKSVIGRNRQHAVKLDFVAGICLTVIDFQCLAFFNFVLVGTVSNDRVQGIVS